MENFIAYCGLNCEACEARLATINNDNNLRKKVADKWSKLNNITITPEMINCEGCRIDGKKTVFLRQTLRDKTMCNEQKI